MIAKLRLLGCFGLTGHTQWAFFLGMVKVQEKIAMIGNLEPEERVLDMGNSPTDKSKDFIRSGMTLITQIDSDKHLKKARDDRRKDSSETGRDNS